MPLCKLALAAQSTRSAFSKPCKEIPDEQGREGLHEAAIDGHWRQNLNQAAGVGLAWGISIAGTLGLLSVVDKVIGLRLSPKTRTKAWTSPSTAKRVTT